MSPERIKRKAQTQTKNNEQKDRKLTSWIREQAKAKHILMEIKNKK